MSCRATPSFPLSYPSPLSFQAFAPPRCASSRGGSASIYDGMRLCEIAAEIRAFNVQRDEILRIKVYRGNKKRQALILKHFLFYDQGKDARVAKYYTQLMFQQKFTYNYLYSFLSEMYEKINLNCYISRAIIKITSSRFLHNHVKED